MVQRRMPPMRSPIQRPNLRGTQPVGETVQSMFEIVKLVEGLKALRAILETKLFEADNAIAQALKIQKGERGTPGAQGIQGGRGPAGISPTEQQLVALIRPLIPSPLKGEKGKDGISVNAEEVAALVMARIVTPRDGKDADANMITDAVIRAIIEGKKLKIEHIAGLREEIASYRNQLARPYLHGGGVPSLSAGANVTLTPKSDGGFIVSASGGGSGTNVATQTGLTAVQAGADVTIALSQLTHFATFVAPVILVMRNQVPQTLGTTYTETATSITVLNADASEIYAITYAYA